MSIEAIPPCGCEEGLASNDSAADATPSDDPSHDASGSSQQPILCSEEAIVSVRQVTVGDLFQRITAHAKITVVDVREPSETATGIIEGAALYPWSSGVLLSEHHHLPSDRSLYLICRSGGRSEPAAEFLVEQGHACVNNVQGGMTAWDANGYPTATPVQGSP